MHWGHRPFLCPCDPCTAPMAAPDMNLTVLLTVCSGLMDINVTLILLSAAMGRWSHDQMHGCSLDAVQSRCNMLQLVLGVTTMVMSAAS